MVHPPLMSWARSFRVGTCGLLLLGALTGCAFLPYPTQGRAPLPVRTIAILVVFDRAAPPADTIDRARREVLAWLERRGLIGPDTRFVSDPSLADEVFAVSLNPDGTYRLTLLAAVGPTNADFPRRSVRYRTDYRTERDEPPFWGPGGYDPFFLYPGRLPYGPVPRRVDPPSGGGTGGPVPRDPPTRLPAPPPPPPPRSAPPAPRESTNDNERLEPRDPEPPR